MFFHLFYVMSLNPNHKLSKNHKNKPLVMLFVCCCPYGQMNFLLKHFCIVSFFLCISAPQTIVLFLTFMIIFIMSPFLSLSHMFQKNHISFIQITQSQKKDNKMYNIYKEIPFNIFIFLFLFAPFF